MTSLTRATVASKPRPWSVSICPLNWPVSTLGMKPIGMAVNRYTVPASSNARTAIVAPLKRIDCRSSQE